jgi:hypothetical protein
LNINELQSNYLPLPGSTAIGRRFGHGRTKRHQPVDAIWSPDGKDAFFKLNSTLNQRT